jgi:hypothetical protein
VALYIKKSIKCIPHVAREPRVAALGPGAALRRGLRPEGVGLGARLARRAPPTAAAPARRRRGRPGYAAPSGGAARRYRRRGSLVVCRCGSAVKVRRVNAHTIVRRTQRTISKIAMAPDKDVTRNAHSDNISILYFSCCMEQLYDA